MLATTSPVAALAVCLAGLAALVAAQTPEAEPTPLPTADPVLAFRASPFSSSSSSSSESSGDAGELVDRFRRPSYSCSGAYGCSGSGGFNNGGSGNGGSGNGGFNNGGYNNGGYNNGGSSNGGYGPGSQGSSSGQRGSPLRVEYAWKKMDFIFPSKAARDEGVRSGRYNYTQIIPLDMDVWEKGGRRKVFVTMPTGAGSPVSLGTVSSEGGGRGGGGGGGPQAPLVAPYPNWSWHSAQGDCRTTISSVYRVAIDDYDRLWVLDRGNDKNCLPKLLTFDLNTDKLLSQFEFGKHLLVNASNLITPVVDVRDHGRNVFVYIADVIGGLIVYDHQRKDAWRVNHPLTLPEERWANHTIAGSNFYLADGAFGMALSPPRCEGRRQADRDGRDGKHRHCDEDRTLYFHSLASVRENYVKTSVLRNKDNFPRGQNRVSSAFKSFDHTRKSQSAAEAMSDEGVLFSGLLPDLAVTCWNSQQSFGGWHLEVVAFDAETLQFTSGMKVRYGRLYVFTCRYQRFATGTMNWNEVNYRVQSARVSDLIRGTKCDAKTNNIG